VNSKEADAGFIERRPEEFSSARIARRQLGRGQIVENEGNGPAGVVDAISQRPAFLGDALLRYEHGVMAFRVSIPISRLLVVGKIPPRSRSAAAKRMLPT
jgi:hypothetical protein